MGMGYQLLLSNLFPTVLGDGRPEIRVPAGPVSVGVLFLVFRWLSSLCPHIAERELSGVLA